MSKRRKLRFPMFLKFLLACLVLAGMLIFGGTLLVQKESTFRNRGNWLAKHLRRYAYFQDRVGRDMTGLVGVLVNDAALRTAVGGASPEADLEPVARPLYDRLMGKNGIAPDVFVVFSPTHKLLWAPKDSPIDPASLPAIAAVEKARSGSAFDH